MRCFSHNPSRLLPPFLLVLTLGLALGLALGFCLVVSPAPLWAEDQPQQEEQVSAASDEATRGEGAQQPSGIPFRFLGATYTFDSAATLGYLYRFDHERIPTAEAAPRILDQKFITHVLHLDLALAVTNRPWADGQFSVGYRYQQDWHSNHKDLSAYLDDPFNFDAFPFRTKLLESDHQLFGWYRHQLTPSLFVNLYGAYRVRHEGALQLALQERKTKPENAPRLRSLKWLPSLFIATTSYGTFLPYLYFTKQQNYADTGLSFETYSLAGTPRLSLGLRHMIPLPVSSERPWRLQTELYRHSYTFNAFYHDYDRLGLVARVDGPLPWLSTMLPLEVGGLLSYSQDSFRHNQIVVNSCRFPDGSASSEITVSCSRKDRNIYGDFWLQYHAAPKHAWSFRYSNIDSQSNLGPHHSFSEFQYILSYKYNFDRFHGSQSFSDTQLDRIYGKKAYTYD